VPAGDGVRYVVDVPAGATFISLEERSGDTRRAWRLPISERRWHPALDEAARLRTTAGSAQAEAAVQKALPELEPELAMRARALIARLRLQDGKIDEAVTGLTATASAAKAAGRLSDWLADSGALVHILTFYKHDLAGARARLDEVAAASNLPADSEAVRLSMEARFSAEAGDLRGALRSFRAAEEVARHLGDARLARGTKGEVAGLLTRIGRAEEGFAAARAVVDETGGNDTDEPPCNVAAEHHNLAWIASVVARRPAASAADPAPLFARARAAYGNCPNREQYRHLILDEALFALGVPDLKTAAARIDELRALATGRSVALSVWQAELEGRLALAQGKSAPAATAFARAAALASAAALTDRELDAETGLGRAMLIAGKRAAAVAPLERAERLLDRLLITVPLGEGRDAYVEARDESARFLVGALLELGRPQDAFEAARRARSRVLRATAFAEQVAGLNPARRSRWVSALGAYRAARARLEEEAANDWQLSEQALAAARERRRAQEAAVRASLDDAYRVLMGSEAGDKQPDALPSPAADEAFVLLFPGATHWIAFVARASSVRPFTLPAAITKPIDDPKSWVSALGPALAGVRRIRLLPYGAAGGVDFHALSWAGEPAPVFTYGLDLPRRSAGRSTAPASALLVGNPAGDLPAAKREVEEVRTLLPGWQLAALLTDEATRAAILERLPTQRLFHYAGHGAFAGTEGLESSLNTARGERILATDILALPMVPSLVVLSSCDAAKASLVGGASLGLAQAFALAGASAVVAPSRPVRDDTALAVVTAFYRELSRAPTFDPPRALQGAQAEVRRTAPSSDWASFRVFVP
jgi:hypothetical protein